MSFRAFNLPVEAPEWEAFRERMWRWRGVRGISQKEMARLMGRKEKVIRDIETGRGMPKASTVLRFQELAERYAAVEGLEMDAVAGCGEEVPGE